MAHYIADLIVKAGSTTGEEKHLNEKTCFGAILTLWKHRAELPNGMRPFEDLEAIVRAIESLDPNGHTPRYFPSARPSQNQGEEKSEVDRWLDIVNGLEYSAKILIGYGLAEAARTAVDKSEEWVKLAAAAGAEDSVSEVVIRFISTNSDLGKEPDPNAEVREELLNRKRRLDSFIKLAETVSADLNNRLDSLPPIQDGKDLGAEEPPLSGLPLSFTQ